jgi:hypothetical protein
VKMASTWGDVDIFAPSTKLVFEILAHKSVRPVLEGIPAGLGVGPIDPWSEGWGGYLDSPTSLDPSITNRELLLRYVLSRSIVDQGSDIPGVELWHRQLVERTYADGIYWLHRPQAMLDRYADVLTHAEVIKGEVVQERAEVWAAVSEGRKAGAYTPFTVDGLRGNPAAHWFLSARVAPALWLALAFPGGMVECVFEGAQQMRPIEMARRLRNAPKYGLGFCLGDKAADLFVKWSIGTLNLGAGMPGVQWTPADTAIPMDQRIGRVMMRSGFMQELYGVSRLMMNKVPFTARPNAGPKPIAAEDPLPEGTWHLTVMNFRRHAKVHGKEAKIWFTNLSEDLNIVPEKGIPPQEALSLLCRGYNIETNEDLTPVHLDDFFMEIAGKWCLDDNPKCGECVLRHACLANNDPAMANLKNYIT